MDAQDQVLPLGVSCYAKRNYDEAFKWLNKSENEMTLRHHHVLLNVTEKDLDAERT